MHKQGKERELVEVKEREERARESVTMSSGELKEQKATQNGAGRIVEGGRSIGGGFCTDRPTVFTEEASSISEILTRVPVEASAAAGFERERSVILESSSYKGLPHSPVDPGIGSEGLFGRYGTGAPPAKVVESGCCHDGMNK